MAVNQFTCPSCSTTLKTSAPKPPGTKIRCPKCKEVFVTRDEEEDVVLPAKEEPKPKAAPRKDKEALQPAAKTKPAIPPRKKPLEDDEDEDDDFDDRPRSRKPVTSEKKGSTGLILVLVGAGTLLLVCLGVAGSLGYFYLLPSKPTSPHVEGPPIKPPDDNNKPPDKPNRLDPAEEARLAAAREQHRLDCQRKEQILIQEIKQRPGSRDGDPAELVTIQVQDQSLNLRALAEAPDGGVLASGGEDMIVRIWSVQTGVEIAAMPGHTGTIRGLAFSPKGGLLASASDDRTVRLWDLTDKSLKKTISGNPQELYELLCVAFSPDGKLLVSGGRGNFKGQQLMLWDVETGNLVRELKGPPNGVRHVAFSPDGRTVASSSIKGSDSAVSFLEVASGMELHKIEYKGAEVTGLAFSPDGKVLAISRGVHGAGADAKEVVLELRNVPSGELKRTFPDKQRFISSVAFSPDGKLLVTGKVDSTIKFWDVDTGKELRHLTWDQDPPQKPRRYEHLVNSVVFSPGGMLLATGSLDHRIRLWDVNELLKGPSVTPPATDIDKFADVEKDRDGTHVTLNEKATDANLAQLKNVPRLVSLSIGDSRNITNDGLVHLRDLKDLRHLDLSSDNISDAGLAHVSGLTNLTRLDLQGMEKITGAGMVHLKGLVNLEELNLESTKVKPSGLEHLKGLTRLKVLDLPDEMTDQGLAHLKGLTALEELDASDGKITDAGLAHLQGMTRMRRLILYLNPDIEGPGLAHLKGMTRLEELDLEDTDVDDAGLAHLKGLTALISLDISDTRVTDAGFVHLNGMTQLASLSIDGLQDLKGPGLQFLKNKPNLQNLSLRNTGVDDTGLMHIKGLTQLQWLTLSSQISDAGFVHLAGLTKLRQLELYQLKKLTGPGLRHLKEMKELHSLHLAETGVTDAGLVHIKELPQLQYLGLPEAVGDAGLVHVLSLTNLKSLFLFKCQVTDNGVALLVKLPNLEELDLSQTRITDASLEHVKKLPKLKHLDVAETKVSKQGVQNLKQAKPGLQVDHDR